MYHHLFNLFAKKYIIYFRIYLIYWSIPVDASSYEHNLILFFLYLGMLYILNTLTAVVSLELLMGMNCLDCLGAIRMLKKKEMSHKSNGYNDFKSWIFLLLKKDKNKVSLLNN